VPYTRRQVRFLESNDSPLTTVQKNKMNAEVHADPALGHHKKGSEAMKKPQKPSDKRTHGFRRTEIEHHMDGSHTVSHYPIPKTSKSGAFQDYGEPTTYSAPDGDEMLAKVGDKLGMNPTEESEEQDV
jgi:hypothetical protein